MSIPSNKNALALKLLVLFVLLLVSTVPTVYVGSVIHDRQFYQNSAVESVVSGWAARHQLGSVKFQAPYYHVEIDEKTKKKERVDDGTLTLDPSFLRISLKDQIEVRRRGIFQIPIYKADLKVNGEILIPKEINSARPDEIFSPNNQTLVFYTKTSGAISEFNFVLNGEKLPLKRTAEGLVLELKERTYKPGDVLRFELSARLNGYDGIDFSSAAGELDISVQSAWPHPSFKGQLPADQNITGKGFTAHWKLIQPAPNQMVSIDYIEPVNIYSQGNRAIKYAFLITLLCLSALFLMETLAGLQIHPMQYLLMILPLSVYYILLIAFAEHIGFNSAYTIASAAVILLIYFYLAGIGATRKQATLLASVLAVVYGLILSMLASEDYALLIGAIFLFLCLATFMLLTRKLNWSRGILMGQVLNG